MYNPLDFLVHDAYQRFQAVQVGGHFPNGPLWHVCLCRVTLQRPRPGRQIRETQHARRREQPGHVRRAAVTCTSRRLRRDLARLRPAPCCIYIYIERERDIYVNILFLIYAAPSTPTQPPQDPVARAPAMPKRRYFQRGAPKRWFSSAGVPTRRCFRR